MKLARKPIKANLPSETLVNSIDSFMRILTKCHYVLDIGDGQIVDNKILRSLEGNKHKNITTYFWTGEIHRDSKVFKNPWHFILAINIYNTIETVANREKFIYQVLSIAKYGALLTVPLSSIPTMSLTKYVKEEFESKLLPNWFCQEEIVEDNLVIYFYTNRR